MVFCWCFLFACLGGFVIFFPSTNELVICSFFEQAERLLGKSFGVSVFNEKYLKIWQGFLVF